MLTVLLLLSTLALSQKCLNHAGKEVNWLVILKTPGATSPSYHYYDSDTTDSFTYYASSPDQPNHPVYNTFNSLSNSEHGIIAWNDQLPNGSTSSTKAHSKTVIGYNITANSGIVAVHSMPLYPTITEHTINPKIADSQSVYGQHFFCFNSGAATKDILTKASIITPFYYANTNKENFNMTSSRSISSIQNYSNSQT